jgi:hypothetical protein
MRDYVKTMERLAFFLPEGVEPTDEQVLEAMRDQAAYKIDMARDRMELFDIPAMTSEEIDKRLNNG